ncbi:alpha-amylase-like [Maniola jurtina]|uniref:alpha-amylase-like n=1 Tax=Maniola jurtina TaxID=191418 RepID=UPI001E689285|nr:alpha-amylase-like [Maniola jurtina]XP_045772517.1 alpha-amylase-like [Maniola jurtina]XP_045772518.1 alpha-amylase-like [Maniola jurtina]XP_045772519.1 alpha-amylase-like [Maniola jurtina]
MKIYLIIFFFNLANGDIRNHMWSNRSTIVHLFEWKWKDIADECERFLAPKGFGGVQISPPSENVIILIGEGRRPWYERYQVMSYKLTTRSGNRTEFLDMTRRCNSVGVRIYADVVVNHMTGSHPSNKGTGGSTADFNNYYYPAVPYNASHFNYPYCVINNYYNAREVRNCQLLGLKDLNQTEEYVRNKIVRYFNKLIKLGVAGFRVDAAKHMWPSDLKEIYKRLDNLNPAFGFAADARPYIYQEVIYYGNEPIRPDEYTPLGDVTEFRVGIELKNVFRGQNAMKWLKSWGPQWGLSPSETALVFIDNHDTQRSNDVLTYKEARAYKAAIAFMLAHPYGNPRLMSSYYFASSDQGPPSDDSENIVSPSINDDDTCGNGWACEHRWRQIYQMVAFRNAVDKTDIQNWWDNGNKQIAFGRGDRGFVVINGDGADLNQTLQTSLPTGKYCDVVSGKKVGNRCSGRKIAVDMNSRAHFFVSQNAEDMHLAIHVGPESRLL